MVTQIAIKDPVYSQDSREGRSHSLHAYIPPTSKILQTFCKQGFMEFMLPLLPVDQDLSIWNHSPVLEGQLLSLHPRVTKKDPITSSDYEHMRRPNQLAARLHTDETTRSSLNQIKDTTVAGRGDFAECPGSGNHPLHNDARHLATQSLMSHFLWF